MTIHKTFLFSYGHGDRRWIFEMQAESAEDARLRVSRLAFATYEGELVAKVPVALGLPVRIGMVLRNWGRKLFGHNGCRPV